MNIGKREQIVIGSIASIILIGALHFFIFASGMAQFKAAKEARDGLKSQIPKMISLNDPELLKKFQLTTSLTLTKLEKGIVQLKLDEPDCFVMRKLDEVVVDPASLKPGEKADEVKKARWDEENKQKSVKQVDLVMEEISKLRASMSNGRVQLSFLGNNPYGWNVLKDLPPQMAGGLLWDRLKMVAYSKDQLDHIDPKNANYRLMTVQYKKNLKDIGIDADAADHTLNRYGAFVPVIYRLIFADMILKKMVASSSPITIKGVPLTREALFTYLQIDLAYDKLDGLDENKVYFLYEELRNLNYLITMAQQQGIKDITSVTFRAYGFIHEQVMPADPDPAIPPDVEKLPDDEFESANDAALAAMLADQQAAANAPPPTDNPDTSGGGGGGGGTFDPNAPSGGDMSGMAVATPAPLPTAPHEGDLGYAIPIRVTFVAPNASGMAYLYEMLRDKPLAELHRLILRSTSLYNQNLTVMANPNSTDVEMTATMLFVPKLFKTKDEVIRIINAIRSGASATPTPTPAPKK